MLEFLTDVSPNMKMVLGAVIAICPLALSNQTVRTKLSSMTGGVFTTIGNWWKSINKNPAAPDVAPSPAGIQIDTPLAVHQVVTPLMAFFARHQDETGVQLAGAVGQHMYEHSATWMTAPKLRPMQAST